MSEAAFFLKAGDTRALGGSGLGEQTKKVAHYSDSLGGVFVLFVHFLAVTA
jgi:hypothetical protein